MPSKIYPHPEDAKRRLEGRVFRRAAPDSTAQLCQRIGLERVTDLARFHSLIEKVRKDTIGEPNWIEEKGAYEYPSRSVQVVAVLKLTRAAHGVTALHLLCQHGLFIDFGAIMRCVIDSVTEVYFLLENFPTTSAFVDQFVESFFGNYPVDKAWQGGA